ncbi:MAG: HEAT repeat domain-containing protein [Planctomycetota bacterium]
MTGPLIRPTRLVTAYRRYLDEQNSPAFASLIGQWYTSATLVSLLNRGQTEQRRAAALALGMMGDRWAIEPLGRALSDSDRGVRIAADDSFRILVLRDAAPVHQQQLLQVMHLNDGGEYAAALSPALILVNQAPRYAEAHHQLAICHDGLGHHAEADAAYRACLWHCRFHYSSWQSLASTRLLMGEPQRALWALDRCLAINPDLESARMQRLVLRRQLRDHFESR